MQTLATLNTHCTEMIGIMDADSQKKKDKERFEKKDKLDKEALQDVKKLSPKLKKYDKFFKDSSVDRYLSQMLTAKHYVGVLKYANLAMESTDAYIKNDTNKDRIEAAKKIQQLLKPLISKLEKKETEIYK